MVYFGSPQACPGDETKITFFANAAQKQRGLARPSCLRHHSDGFSPISHAVAGGTVGDATANQFLFTCKRPILWALRRFASTTAFPLKGPSLVFLTILGCAVRFSLRVSAYTVFWPNRWAWPAASSPPVQKPSIPVLKARIVNQICCVAPSVLRRTAFPRTRVSNPALAAYNAAV